jgi:SulP family sulfate permease
VIEGFTVGIAILIFLQQVPAALGVPRPEGENSAAIAARAVREALSGDATTSAIVLVLVVVATMLVVPRIRRTLPASLIAVAVATVVAELLDLDAQRIGALPSSLPLPSLPSSSFGEARDLASAALAVALLAAIESLLSAKVADGMAGVGRHDPDRELFGQGLANVVSPLFGGMPATGAIARTAVNIRAGARTRVAAIVHAALLVVVVFAGSGLVSKIPLAALAGVLMVTACRMVEVHNVRAVLHSTRSDAITLVLTTIATVAFDLIVAIEVGVAVAGFFALRHVARNAEAVGERLPALYARRELDEPEELDELGLDAEALLHDHIVLYRIDGALFFGAAQRFLTELTAVTDARVVILRLSQVQVLDATGAQTLGEIVSELEHRGVTVLIKGVQPRHRRILVAVGALDRLRHERHLFDRLDEAVAHARRHAVTEAPLAHA